MIWVIGSIMMIAALVMLLFPLWRRHTRSITLDSNTANVALLKDQLEELETDYRNGVLTQEQYEQARQDLESAVAADLDNEHAASSQLPAVTRNVLSLVLILAIPLITVVMYSNITTYQETEALDPVAAHTEQVQQAMEQAAGQKLPPVDQMVEGLAAKLRQNPDNVEGWRMLGKSYFMLNRYSQAAGAYAKAYELMSDAQRDPDFLTDYAEAMALGNDGNVLGRPEELIQAALQVNPDVPKAIWMKGIAESQRGDYAAAVKSWTSLLHMGVDEQTRQMVMNNISDARARMGLPDTQNLAANNSSIEAIDVDLTESTMSAPAAASASIKVQVNLDPSLQNQVRQNETIFVFAKAVAGMPAPLAVQRFSVADLPITVTLDDSMAMMAGHNLSSKEQVIVGARVSRSGSPMTQPGDLQGLSAPLATASVSEVDIVINQVVEN